MVDEATATALAASNAVGVLRNQICFHLEGNPSNPMYGEKRRAATAAVEKMHGLVERLEIRAGPGNDLALAMGAWQLSIEEAFIALKATPPTDFAAHDGTRMLNFSVRRYKDFMGVAGSYLEQHSPP